VAYKPADGILIPTAKPPAKEILPNLSCKLKWLLCHYGYS